MAKARAKTKPKKRLYPAWLTRRRLLIGSASLVVVVGLYAGVAAATVAGYYARLGQGSFNFAGRLQFTGSDFLSTLNSDVTFAGSYAKAGSGATFSGNWAGRQYTGDLRSSGGKLYYQLAGPVMPVIRYRQSTYTYPLAAGVWYSQNLDESLYNNLCAHTQPATLEGKLSLYRAVKSLKITPSPIINYLSANAGQHATHISGGVSGAQIAALWDALAASAPPGCGDPNTLGLSGADLAHAAGHLDLYAGAKSDRLIVTLTDKTLGAKAVITLDTTDYGHAAIIAAPASATDLSALFSRLKVAPGTPVD